MKFDVIVADPCWSFSDKLTMSDVKRGAGSQYAVLDTETIKALDVASISADNAVLALWVPSSLLQDGLDTMQAWGFNHKQTYVWVKVKNTPYSVYIKNLLSGIESASKSYGYAKKYWRGYFSLKAPSLNEMLAFGLGRLFRQTHELCLVGTRGKVYGNLMDKSQRSVCFGSVAKHSEKPEDLQDSLEKMFPKAKRCELFARRDRKGWHCYGLECPSSAGQDIRESIVRLTKMR